MGHVGKYTIHIDAMGNYGIQDPLVGAQFHNPAGGAMNRRVSTSFGRDGGGESNSEAMSDSGSQPWKLW